MLPMKFRIWQRKLNLIHHIANLSAKSLAKQVFDLQSHFSFPGLVKEVKEMIIILKIPDITQQNVAERISKQSWKKIVKKAIREKCGKNLFDQIKSYKKLETLFTEGKLFQKKSYLKEMSLSDARIMFK